MPLPILENFTKIRRYPNDSNLANAKDVASEGLGKYIKVLSAGNGEAILFDLAAGYNFEQKIPARRRGPISKTASYFSLSRMVIPEYFELIKYPVPVDPNRRKPSVETILKHREDISLENKLYIDLAHNFSAEEDHFHPCHDLDCLPEAAAIPQMYDTTAVSEEEKPVVYFGAKACAYAVYTLDAQTGQPNFLFYYRMVAEDKVKEILAKQYSLIPEDSGLKKYGETSSWDNLIMIPLQLPNASIIFYAIPDTPKGKKAFNAWINLARANASVSIGGNYKSMIKIDYTLEHIDAWEVFITLDAEIIKLSAPPQPMPQES